MEGEIWITDHYFQSPETPQDYKPPCHQVFTPPYGRRFVDVQIAGGYNLEKLTALCDHGNIHIWSPTGQWSQVINAQCSKLACVRIKDALVYSSPETLVLQYTAGETNYNKFMTTRQLTRELSQPVVDLAGVWAGGSGFKIVMLMQDNSVIVHDVIEQQNSPELLIRERDSPLEAVSDLVDQGDCVHSIAAHSDESEGGCRVWFLTAKGKLIEYCFGANGEFANVYAGIEGIVAVSLGPIYRDHYAHRWDGSVYWLGDQYTFTACKIESDPCVFRYLQRDKHGSTNNFVGVTALYL